MNTQPTTHPTSDRAAQELEASLEAQANQILFESISDIGRGDHPFYSTSYVRRLQDADKNLASESEAEHSDPPSLQLAMVWKAVRRARLTTLEADLLRTLARGVTMAQATAVLGMNRRRATRTLMSAFAKIRPHLERACSELDDQVGWVLYEEQRRRARTRETHCLRGQEACRLTGLCPHRWYLTQLQ